MLKQNLFALCFLLFSFASINLQAADSGNDTTNGGSITHGGTQIQIDILLRYQMYSQAIAVGGLCEVLSPEQIEVVKSILQKIIAGEVPINVSETPILSDDGKERDAVNTYPNLSLTVQRQRWLALDGGQQELLLFHELMSLAQLETSESYFYTVKYVSKDAWLFGYLYSAVGNYQACRDSLERDKKQPEIFPGFFRLRERNCLQLKPACYQH